MYVDCDIAESILANAYTYNPGNWREHSRNVAYAAKTIAQNIPNMNPEKAYSLGILHDIGRIKGVTHLKHTIDGYNYLINLGYDDNAHICLTHSFPLKILESYSGNIDCTDEECNFIANFLSTTNYDEYDKLIQLCDAIAKPNGICILEKRLFDVALRNGINDYTIEKWKAFLKLKEHFDDIVGNNIYELFEISLNT